jgi:zinc protease
VAVEVTAATEGRRGPDVFTLDVKLASGAHVEHVAKLVDTQLVELGRAGPTDDELQKLQSRLRLRNFFQLASNLERATRAAELELDRGDATIANGELEKYLAVSKDDLRRVVATYLTSARRSAVEVKPGEKN